MDQGSKGVVVVCLVKTLVAKKVGVIAHQVRNLLEDQDEPDGSHHSFNHGVGYVVAHHTQFKQAHCNLNHSRQYHSDQEDFEGPQVADCREDHGGEAGRRTRNAQGRSAEGANDYATYHAGYNSAKHGGARA